MSTEFQQNAHRSPALEFKSSTFSVPVLILADNNLENIERQLEEKVHLAPEFFKHSPLIFDLQGLNNQDLEIDVAELISTMRKLDLLPIGIRGGNTDQIRQARDFGIPVHSNHGSTVAIETKQQVQEPKVEPVLEQQTIAEISTTMITHHVRSGQRIYAKGDLIILAPVSAGAEILAEGNIHVYGALRGRALAGVQGDVDARIFCFDLQAELISIAGHYKVNEDLHGIVPNQPVQIYLQDHALIIKPI